MTAMRTPSRTPHSTERGVTLVELMIALVVLAVGVLALAQTFPAGGRAQVRDRMFSSANAFMQDKVEELTTKDWGSADLDLGRHPASGFDTVGTNRNLLRYYEVASMASPLDNLRKVTVRMNWRYMGARACSTTIYVRR
jgi:prepilin-type N-terminal cleavage/methylation domain-containing protein